jgi:STE24 endopeptidase
MNEPRATRYQRLRRRAHAAGVLSGVVMLAVVALTPIGASLAGAVAAYVRGAPPWSAAVLSTLLFVVCLVILWECAVLPAMLYLSLKVDRRYGAAALGADAAIAAQAQATMVVLPAAAGAGLIVQLSANAAGAAWWAVAGVLIAAAMVMALHWAPRVVAQLTGARPLADADLVERLARLAERAGVPVAGIDEVAVDGDRLTALVTGIGTSRRVFISREVARRWSPDEVAVIVAHELGHHAHHDLRRTLALDGTVLAAGLFAADRLVAAATVQGVVDLGALPLIALAAGAVWLAATPIRHAQSRRQERRADAFALRLTGDAEAFSAALRRLAARHLAEERPSVLIEWLYHRHPPVADRLAFASAFVANSTVTTSRRPPAPQRIRQEERGRGPE